MCGIYIHTDGIMLSLRGTSYMFVDFMYTNIMMDRCAWMRPSRLLPLNHSLTHAPIICSAPPSPLLSHMCCARIYNPLEELRGIFEFTLHNTQQMGGDVVPTKSTSTKHKHTTPSVGPQKHTSFMETYSIYIYIWTNAVRAD